MQNMSWREPPNVKVNGCFYSGNVSGEPDSIVSVSLCDGIVSTNLLKHYYFIIGFQVITRENDIFALSLGI